MSAVSQTFTAGFRALAGGAGARDGLEKFMDFSARVNIFVTICERHYPGLPVPMDADWVVGSFVRKPPI